MFVKLVKSTLAIATIITGAIFASAPAQAASSFGIYIGNGHGPQVYYGPTRHQYVKRTHRYGYCKPRHALNKAYHLGVGHAHIARVNKRKIVVKGYSYGHPAKVVFKRSHRGCKIIKTRGLY